MCPNCGQPLVIYEIDSLEADVCVACKGIWLDSGELELIATQCGVDPAELLPALESARHLGSRKHRCPRCKTRMDLIGIVGDPPIQLDRCPRGHGLWFDRGEVHALLATRSRSVAAPEVVRRLADLFAYETQSKG